MQDVFSVPWIRKSGADTDAAAGKGKGGDAAVDGARKARHMTHVVLEMAKLCACLYVASLQ